MERDSDGSTGCFITFEGVEGAGKSSRCLTLIDSLEKSGIEVVHTREPGGPFASEKIRSILLDPDLTVPPLTELMLYLASRASNVELIVRPALESGQHVICERYSDATYAYQIGGRGLPSEPVKESDRLATGGLIPDLTILLDIDPEEGFRRLIRQGRKRDRIELEDIAFHRRVRRMYLDMAKSFDRFFVVDAMLNPAQQDEIILSNVISLIARRSIKTEEKDK